MADEAYNNAWSSPGMQEWAEDVLKNMAPKVENSDVVMSLFDGRHDVKLWVETGAALFMDKPIIIAALDGTPIPEKLKIVANEIVRITSDEIHSGAAGPKFEAAVERVLASVGSDES